MLILDQFGIIQNLQMSPIPQTSFLVGIFFGVSYRKTALVKPGTTLGCRCYVDNQQGFFLLKFIIYFHQPLIQFDFFAQTIS